MSEMVRHQGVIKRLSTKENLKEVYEKLIADGKHENKWDDLSEDGTPTWVDSENYAIVNGCLFDISDIPTMYDDAGEVEEGERLNETDYKIHAYYYNGGAGLTEVLDDIVEKADAEYQESQSEYKDADNLKIRMHLEKWDEPEKTYVYENTLKNLLQDDDGGLYGEESAQAEAADRVDGDNSLWEDWHVVKREYIV